MVKLFVVCAQSLEEILAQELYELGYQDVEVGYRGVYVEASEEAIYEINYCSRIAGRVLLPLLNFRCQTKEQLYESAKKIPWEKYIPFGKTIAIDSNVSHPQLRNSLFASQLLKDAICDRLKELRGERPSVDLKEPDIQLNLFIQHQRGIISFDTSGIPLFKRGYRQESVEAPIQESLAAALLYLLNYQGDEILYDPCCGSGTILIEAALMASRTAPGYLRQQWPFKYLPFYDHQKWLAVKARADDRRIPLQPNKFFGTEINKNAVRICKTNLRAAGFHQSIDIQQYDFREFEPTIKPNLILTNPPHGMRLNEVESLKPLYRGFGDWMKRKAEKPARGGIFTSSMELAKEVGLSAKRRHVIMNSGVESRFLEYEIYHGSEKE